MKLRVFSFVVLVLARSIGFSSASDPVTATPSKPPSTSSHGHGHDHGGGDDATVRHSFSDAKKWSKMFDDPSRAEWQKPEEVVAALGLAPGDRVADVGAGTGYFLQHLSKAVGESGTVFAVEVEPNLVEHMRKRAEKEKTANVIPVLGSFDDPRLPAGFLDLILIVDTYHHIDDRLEYFRRLAKTLSPKGRIAIVDFEKRPLPVGPKMDHKLDKRVYLDEMKAAGYELEKDLDELLPYQYFMLFRSSTQAAKK